MASPRTRSGTPRLSDLARKVVVPSGITSTGWPGVRDTCRQKLGLTFDPWQDATGRVILAKRKTGKLATTVGGVGMSLPRQVGKTYLMAGTLFALCVNTPGLLCIWTAHHLKTSGETFLAMQAFAQRHRVAPYVRRVLTGSGNSEIEFVNGSRILFGARERGFGRGIPGVDVIVFDEAQKLSDGALDAMVATLNTSSLGLHVYIGTPPRPGDDSEAFTRMRTEAWSGQMEDSAWVEFGCDDGYAPPPKPAPLVAADWRQVEKANPSYPDRTPRESILRLRKKLSDESYLREGLGAWDSTARLGAFGPGASWESVPKVDRPPDLAPGALGVAVSLDLAHAALVAAADVDGRTLLRVVGHVPTARMGALLDELGAVQAEHGCPVVIDGKGPGADYVPPIRDLVGDALHVASLDELKDGCAGLYKAVRDGGVVHACDADGDGERLDELDRAVAAATRRDVGDRWLWGRRKSGDICSLEAATLAAWGLTIETEPAPVSAYESRGVLTI